MLPNSKKCHYGSLGKSSNDDKFVFGNLCLENSNKKVILGYNNRQLLTFDSRIKICVEKLIKNFVHYREYLIIWKQTKKVYFLME